jgi:fructose/tagatose bisphosphate aldolase
MQMRAIIVHSLEDARAAAAAAADLGVPLTLASAPGAAAYLGALWFRQMTRIVAEEFPDVALVAILDCGDKPGHALAAFRHGITHVRFTGKRSVAQKLAAIAAQSGAEVTTERLRALDLLDEPDPAAACHRWLAKR